MEHLVVICLSLSILFLLFALARIARNVGPLGLEDYARRKDCAYIPVSKELVGSMGEWSQPVQLRLAGDHPQHPLLVEIEIRTLPETKA